MAMAAPNPAPAETPSLSGDTKGFLNKPWKAAPAIDKAAPTSIAASILGSLIWKITASEGRGTLVLMGINFEPTTISTSRGLMGYLPIRNEMKNKRINGMVSRKRVEVR